MRSSSTLGIVFIVVGGIAVSPLGGHHGLPSPLALSIVALLIVAGVLLLLKRSFAFWVAVAAALVTAATGVLALTGHPQWALPLPPWLSIVVGLYLALRTTLARFSDAQPKRRFAPPPDENA